jgi:hypothetical protein
VLSGAVIPGIGYEDRARLSLYTGPDSIWPDRMHLSLVPALFQSEALCGEVMTGSTAAETGGAKRQCVNCPDCAVRVRALRSQV